MGQWMRQQTSQFQTDDQCLKGDLCRLMLETLQGLNLFLLYLE